MQASRQRPARLVAILVLCLAASGAGSEASGAPHRVKNGAGEPRGTIGQLVLRCEIGSQRSSSPFGRKRFTRHCPLLMRSRAEEQGGSPP